jgi:hypothetical protein
MLCIITKSLRQKQEAGERQAPAGMVIRAARSSRDELPLGGGRELHVLESRQLVVAQVRSEWKFGC